MPSRKTCEPASTDLELSKAVSPKTKRGKTIFRTIIDENVRCALTFWMKSINAINDDEEVIHYFKVPEGIEVKIGVIHD